MAQQVSVTTFQRSERFEPKVLPPEEEGSTFAVMIHYGDKNLLSLSMTKGQLVSLYSVIKSALRDEGEAEQSVGSEPGQQSFLNSDGETEKSLISG